MFDARLLAPVTLDVLLLDDRPLTRLWLGVLRLSRPRISVLERLDAADDRLSLVKCDVVIVSLDVEPAEAARWLRARSASRQRPALVLASPSLDVAIGGYADLVFLGDGRMQAVFDLLILLDRACGISAWTARNMLEGKETPRLGMTPTCRPLRPPVSGKK